MSRLATTKQTTPSAEFPSAGAGVALGAAAALLVVLYYPTFIMLTEYWAENDIYSYAFLVPVISAVLIWAKRNEWMPIRATPSLAWGSVVLMLGLILLLAGRRSSTNLVEEVSFVVTVFGLALLLFGPRIVRIIAFPLAFLLSMVPFWEFLTNRLHWPFQLYSAIIGVGTLRMFGIPVLREGIYIELPNVTLEVAEACSGINNLIAVLCLGVPLTYLHVKSWLKRLLIVAMAVMIALLSNAVRVAMVSLLAFYEIRGAGGDIHGPYSLLRSFVISGVGFVALFWLISKFADHTPSDAVTSVDRRAVRHLVIPAAMAVAIIILAGFAGFDRWQGVKVVPLSQSLRTFPDTIGTWHANALPSFSSNLASLEFDEKITRNYKGAGGTEVNLFLGYFASQVQNRELAGFRIRDALVGREPSSYKVPTAQVHVHDFIAVKASDSYHVTYWYLLGERVVSTHQGAKFGTAWNSIVRGETSGGIVVVTSKAIDGEPITSARLRDRDFVEQLISLTTGASRKRTAERNSTFSEPTTDARTRRTTG